MHFRFYAPPCLTSMCLTNLLYILPSLPLSLRALMNYYPMHVMYAFFNENAHVSNMSYGNCVTTFDIHFCRPQIALCRAVTFLSTFFYG